MCNLFAFLGDFLYQKWKMDCCLDIKDDASYHLPIHCSSSRSQLFFLLIISDTSKIKCTPFLRIHFSFYLHGYIAIQLMVPTTVRCRLIVQVITFLLFILHFCSSANAFSSLIEVSSIHMHLWQEITFFLFCI